jgi:heme-degrading monooxygenase HmoA
MEPCGSRDDITERAHRGFGKGPDSVIRSVLYLEPKDGDYDALVEFFRREDVLGRALSQQGCIGGELQVPTTRSGPILVTALWESEDAYQGWVVSPVRAASTEPLARLLRSDLEESTRGETYTIVLTAGEAGPATTVSFS